MTTKIWYGSNPQRCQLCNRTFVDGEFIDGRTMHGPWAMMCPTCHHDNGVGLGTGKGQRYALNPETEEWEKVEG